MNASSTLSTLCRHLMRTSTEFKSEVSAPTISRSFYFLVEAEVGVYACMCVSAFLSRSLVTPRHRCVMMHEVDAYKDRF